jgi:hypothetical protein
MSNAERVTQVALASRPIFLPELLSLVLDNNLHAIQDHKLLSPFCDMRR